MWEGAKSSTGHEARDQVICWGGGGEGDDGMKGEAKGRKALLRVEKEVMGNRVRLLSMHRAHLRSVAVNFEWTLSAGLCV